MQPLNLSPADKTPTSPGTNWPLLVAAAAVFAVLFTSLAIVDPPSSPGETRNQPIASHAASGETQTVDIVIKGMQFVPNKIEVQAGASMTIHLKNEDTMIHDLELDTGPKTGFIQPGESVTLEAGVVSEATQGWCTLPGHRQMGMTLDISTTEATAGEDSGASNDSDAKSDDTSARGDNADHGGHGSSGAQGAAAEARTLPMGDFTNQPAAQTVDATAPRLKPGNVHRVKLEAREGQFDMGAGLNRTIWSFNGKPVAPTLRGKVGDTFEVTLVNKGTMNHSVDFHASFLAPDKPMRQIAPGESLTYTFKAERAGMWLYHCGAMPMSMHMSAGMHGAVIVDPPDLPPVDREFTLVQSEVYLNDKNEPDAQKAMAGTADYVVFNGIPYQYNVKPLEVKTGQRVRFWVMAAGPNYGTSFHVIGGQFDTVFKEGTYMVQNGSSPQWAGAQTLGLHASEGGFVEMVFPEAGTYKFVDHQMMNAEKGALGLVHVTD